MLRWHQHQSTTAMAMNSYGALRIGGHPLAWTHGSTSGLARILGMGLFQRCSLDGRSPWNTSFACTYRGSEEQVVTWPSLKYDCTSVLGCLAIVGVLAQIRGLATAVQEKMVVLLREMCSCMQATRLLLLPGVYIDVDGAGNTSLHELKGALPCREWTSLKTRHLAKRYVLFVSSVTNDCCSAYVAQCLCFAIVFKSILTVKNNKHFKQWLVEWWGRSNVNMRTWT